MKYTSRLKIIAEKKSLLNRITYDFVNETAKQVFKENKLDSNWCTKVYDCDKDDKVYFDIKIDKKISNMRCYYKPRLNGTYKDSIYYMKTPPLIIKPEGLQKNSNGNSILVLSSTKNNENLATILHEKTKGANEYIASTSDAVGILRNGVKVYDKNNFSWGGVRF